MKLFPKGFKFKKLLKKVAKVAGTSGAAVGGLSMQIEGVTSVQAGQNALYTAIATAFFTALFNYLSQVFKKES